MVHFNLMKISAAMSVAAALVQVIPAAGQDVEDIEKGFNQIPDSIRTAVYWYWISDNISSDGVVKDLHAMKQAGINTAFLGSMGVDGVPYGKVKFFSDEWWDITHTALRTASDLGIDIGIFNSPGWSQSGGPWVKPGQAMRYISSDTVKAEGDGSLQTIVLPEGKEGSSLYKVLAYPVMAEATAASVTVNKTEGQPARADFALDEDMTVRSVTVKVCSPVRTAVSLFSGTGESRRMVASFDVDRSNPALNVGFDPFAPVVISVPGVRGRDFSVEFSSQGAGVMEVTVSDKPCVERYPEKSLAKMFQSPLPMWDEYMWRTPEETSGEVPPVRPSEVADLTGKVRDGVLEWQVSDGKWCIMALSLVPTGVTNSPAVPEATGLEVDKMSRSHVRSHFDAYIGKILERIPEQDRRSFKIVVQDSYETGGTNWTDDMEEVFTRTYGYDPVPFLPVLAGEVVGSQDISDRFLWDLRRLIADRVAYDYVGGLRDVCHEHGLQTWLENYGHWGFPGEFLMYGGQSDNISGEFWSEGTLGDIENRAASSCGHIYGKPQIWAESCTSGGPAFSRYPRLMKQRVDRFFTEGINSTLLHLYIQQPDDRKPGLDAWFGNEFNRNNTWFGYMDLFTSYLKRCNFMLQQGRYVADVAYFIGEDAPKMTGVCDPALPYGYSFDYINAEVLMEHSRVRDGKLVLDSGMEYRLLVLPVQETMRPEVLARIESLVDAGLVVTGPAPKRSPSLEGYPAADIKVKDMAETMWNAPAGARFSRYGQGKVYPEGTPLGDIFKDLDAGPDFSAGSSQDDILFIHRTLGEGTGGEIWFVSNQKDGPVSADMSFRVSGMVPEIWDPVSGKISPAGYTEKDGRTYVSMDFGPLSSVFVVFRPGGPRPAASEAAVRDVAVIDSGWTVCFDQGGEFAPGAALPGCPEPFEADSDSLFDWSLSADPRIKYYSGTAVYRTQVKIRKKDDGTRYVLDLGKVMVMAKVKVNGVCAGGVWTDPYSLDITGLVRNGKNVIEVMVANNWMNRLVKDASLPEEERLTWTNINPYAPDSPLQSSGLLGPVKLVKETYESH